MRWFCVENIIQVLHLILVYVYLMLVFLDCGSSASVGHVDALVVCVAWLDLSYSIKYLRSWAPYMRMLVDVSQKVNIEYQLKSLLRLQRR